MQNPIVLNRADASGQGPRYFLGSEDYVVDKGLLESFIRLGNERGDLARKLNDQLIADGSYKRVFVIQRRGDNVEQIQAEFVCRLEKCRTIVGPVAASLAAKKLEVRDRRLEFLAILSRDPRITKGEVYALSVPGKWGDDERLLEMLGFDFETLLPVKTKASLLELSRGQQVRIGRQNHTELVPANEWRRSVKKITKSIGGMFRRVRAVRYTTGTAAEVILDADPHSKNSE